MLVEIFSQPHYLLFHQAVLIIWCVDLSCTIFLAARRPIYFQGFIFIFHFIVTFTSRHYYCNIQYYADFIAFHESSYLVATTGTGNKSRTLYQSKSCTSVMPGPLYSSPSIYQGWRMSEWMLGHTGLEWSLTCEMFQVLI